MSAGPAGPGRGRAAARPEPGPDPDRPAAGGHGLLTVTQCQWQVAAGTWPGRRRGNHRRLTEAAGPLSVRLRVELDS